MKHLSRFRDRLVAGAILVWIAFILTVSILGMLVDPTGGPSVTLPRRESRP